MDHPHPPPEHSDHVHTPLKPPPLGTLISRALSLRCPRCGNGKLFTGWFTMPERCGGCNFRFERDPGYFLGSTYLNYGATAVLLLIVYPTLHLGWSFTNQELAPWLAGVCIVFPLWFFRYARALWLALDCHFDTSVYEE